MNKLHIYMNYEIKELICHALWKSTMPMIYFKCLWVRSPSFSMPIYITVCACRSQSYLKELWCWDEPFKFF